MLIVSTPKGCVYAKISIMKLGTQDAQFTITVAITACVMKEFRCHEAEIEESKKAGSHQESNPGHLWLETPVFCH